MARPRPRSEVLDRTVAHRDRKSLRLVTGAKTNFGELAQGCVCFANAAGGTLLIGIEDDSDVPPTEQRVDPELLDRIRKRIGELTVNVQVVPELKRHVNGGEYIALAIPRAVGVASTSDGRYFLRVGDTCQPIVGDRHARASLGSAPIVQAIKYDEREELADANALRPWLGRLLTWGLVEQSGRTKATRYFVPPALLRDAGLDALTTLTRVQPHRLRALILEDLERFPDSAISDVHRRIGLEIPPRTVKRAFDLLVREGTISTLGELRWRRYRLVKPIDQGGSGGR